MFTLKDKILISTVNAAKFDELKKIFDNSGATILNFPMIEVVASVLSEYEEQIIADLQKYDWIIFTSANGVKYFAEYLNANNLNVPENIKIASVGKSTAKTINNCQLSVVSCQFMSSGNTAEDLINEMLEKDLLQNKNILLPLGNLAPDFIENRLKNIAETKRINIYRTIKPEKIDIEIIEKIRNNKYDLVLFTSPSGIENFIDTIGKENIPQELKIASIGKVTAAAVEKNGYKNIVIAEKSTYEGLKEEIEKFYENII